MAMWLKLRNGKSIRLRKGSIVCVDLDGVLNHTPDNPPPPESYKIFRPNKKMIRLLRKMREEEVCIVIYTARRLEDREITMKFLKKYRVPYDMVILGKPYADLYIDDRAIRPEELVL
jgi:uncharacterized HAD superfamily protein